MAEKKTHSSRVTPSKEPIAKKAQVTVGAPLFVKENFIWMGIGAAVIAVGMMLLAGGKNENANQFDYNVVYNFRIVTIAPIFILLGLLIEIYAIFKKPKAHQ